MKYAFDRENDASLTWLVAILCWELWSIDCMSVTLRFKGAREITPGARHFFFTEGDTYTLIINNVYGADADEYVCRAVNKGGVKSTRAELIIMSK